MNLDEGTKRVVEMYSRYPFPFRGNYDNYFARIVLPSIREHSKDRPMRRLLDAGCGTGNLSFDMATWLSDVEVIGIDLTEESLSLARKGAAQRGLKNVSFRSSNLMQHDPALGKFDFVYCQGVIHHLSDPLQGMKNLNRYLEEERYGFVWLYSLLGRRRILEMREALRILGAEVLPWEQRLQLARAARPLFLSQRLTFLRKVIKVLDYIDRNGLKGLGSYVKRRPSKGPTEDEYANIHLADMILHPQDKYYRFAEALDLFHEAGFEFVRVLQGMSNTIEECFGAEPIFNGKKFSRREAYILMELHQQPEGIGFLIKKTREV